MEPVYDAFISYKHAAFDTEICKLLHRTLEAYRIVKNGEIHRIKRVFLDTAELASSGSLSESIQTALDNSRFLIVVCSKKTPSSPWVGKEIEYFIKNYGHQNVLALLIDGEPEESFPLQLRFIEINGVMTDIEPLAADIRRDTHARVKKALKTEVLRLLAPLLGMTYDDLAQRHQKRAMRRVIQTALIIAAVFLGFGAFAAGQWYNIAQKNRHILTLQSKSMANDSNALLSKGDRRMALYVARHALPPDRPYTEEAEMALTEALGVYYYPPSIFNKDTIFTYDTSITDYALDPTGTLLAVLTQESLSIRDIETGRLIIDLPFDINSNKYGDLYFSQDKILYTTVIDGVLCAVNAETGDILWKNDALKFGVGGSVLLGADWDGVYLIDPDTGAVINTLAIDGGYTVSVSDGRYAAVDTLDEIYFIDTLNLETVLQIDSPGLCDILFYEDIGAVWYMDFDIFTGDTEYHLIIYDLNSGDMLDELRETNYNKAVLLDSHRVLLIASNGFAVYDYRTQEYIERTSTLDSSGALAVGDLLFLALSQGGVKIYDTELGFAYDGYSFDSAENLYDPQIADGVFAALKNSEIYIFRHFRPPVFNDLEIDIIWAEFLANDQMLALVWNDGYQFELFSDNRLISKLETDGYVRCAYDANTGLLYYLTDLELTVCRVSSDGLSVLRTIEADDMRNIKITDGIPVIYNDKEVIFIRETGEERYESAYIKDVFRKDRAVLLAGLYELEIILDRETYLKPLSNPYAINPVSDEYVYYADNELIFCPLFTDDAKTLALNIPGMIECLFFSPDGDFLFVATETKRLFAIDTDTQTMNELIAEFRQTPAEALYIGDKLGIRDSWGYVTLWGEAHKIIGRIDADLKAFSTDKIAVSNGFNTGITPIYDTPMLIDLADKILADRIIDADKARHYIE